MADLETFRAETRDWLAANCPPEMRQPITGEGDVVWGGRNAKLTRAAAGVARRDGGARLDRPRMADANTAAAGCRRTRRRCWRRRCAPSARGRRSSSFGIWMLGPALLKYGSEAQKREHLPKIARGEIRWCQGYSEPGAGSDLASLRTSAVIDGDDYIVNGQKVWTSYADKADWIFCLVRTDPDAPKHLGISFLLFDMATPGVSTSPIKLISGYSPFCQTFFDDVRVPRANLVGDGGQGLGHRQVSADPRARDDRRPRRRPPLAQPDRGQGARRGRRRAACAPTSSATRSTRSPSG